MAYHGSRTAIVSFLKYPFQTWLSTALYIGICCILLSILVFLGKKYVEIIRRQPTRCSQVVSDNESRFQLLTSQYVYPRTPYPKSPLIQVTSASSDTSSETSEASNHPEKIMRSRIPRKPVSRSWITVGPVEDGRIAKRRRLSNPKVE